jgi:hypothetical protein
MAPGQYRPPGQFRLPGHFAHPGPGPGGQPLGGPPFTSQPPGGPYGPAWSEPVAPVRPPAAGPGAPPLYADGTAEAALPRAPQPVDDSERILTPTTIFAPGSRVTPPDEDDPQAPPPAQGPGSAQSGHGSQAGYGTFPGPGAAPERGYPGPDGYQPYPPQAPRTAAGGPGRYPGSGQPASAQPGFAQPQAGAGRPYPGGPAGTSAPAGPPPGYAGGYGQPHPDQGYTGRPHPDQYPGQPGPGAVYNPDPRARAHPQAREWQSADGPAASRPPYGNTGPGAYSGAQHPADQYPGGAPYPGGQYPGDRYGGGPYPGDRQYGGSPYPGGPEPARPSAGYAPADSRDTAFSGPRGNPEADGFSGSRDRGAPAPERAWQTDREPDGYSGAEPGGDTVNGGGYAYVLRQEDPPAPPQDGPRTRPGPQGHQNRPGQDRDQTGSVPDGGEPRPGSPADTPPADALPAGPRAITAGLVGLGSLFTPANPARAAGPAPRETGTVPRNTATTPGDTGTAPRPWSAVAQEMAASPDRGKTAPSASPAESADVYGPDDPAYGPTAAGWRQRDDDLAAPSGDGVPAAAPEESEGAVRGPFEPLRSAGDAPVQSGLADTALAEPELDDVLDFGSPSDPEAGNVGELRDLYLTAEAISPVRLDRHFDELLERQRRLIAEYFTESPGPDPAEPDERDKPFEPERPAPFGFDTADSLAGLRGDLRGA